MYSIFKGVNLFNNFQKNNFFFKNVQKITIFLNRVANLTTNPPLIFVIYKIFLRCAFHQRSGVSCSQAAK